MRVYRAVLVWLTAALIVGSTAMAEEHIVKVITDNENGITAFQPKFLVIKKGDTVTWVNTMNDLHNVITYPDGFPKGGKGFESPYLKQEGDTWSYTFEEKGTYQYHCIPHIFMGMRGTITVNLPTRQNQFHKPSMDEIKAYRSKLLEFFDSEEFMIMPDAVKRNVHPE